MGSGGCNNAAEPAQNGGFYEAAEADGISQQDIRQRGREAAGSKVAQAENSRESENAARKRQVIFMDRILTITIPAYNAEAFLAQCLDSLLSCEASKETELLVIDDGSTDRTGTIADGYAERYPDIVRVIHKENGGHGSGINTGIAAAGGKYFRVVDSDDTVDPKAYESYLKKLKSIDSDVCPRYGRQPRLSSAPEKEKQGRLTEREPAPFWPAGSAAGWPSGQCVPKGAAASGRRKQWAAAGEGICL